MVYKGYEGLSQEQIKEKIIVEYYTTGGVNGKKINDKKQNGEIELKKHAERSLGMFYGISDTGEYVDDLYQEVFEYFCGLTPEYFCETFFTENGEVNYQRLFATAGNRLRWKGTGKGNHPKHSFMMGVMHASSSNAGNFSFNADSNDEFRNIEQIINVVDEDLRFYGDEVDEIEEVKPITFERLKPYLTESELLIWDKKQGRLKVEVEADQRKKSFMNIGCFARS